MGSKSGEVTCTEHGKPIGLLISQEKVSLSQERPNGLLVNDDGESKRPSVMVGIGIVTLSHTKVGRLPSGNSLRKEV